MYRNDEEKILALRIPNMDGKVSSCSSLIILYFGFCCNVLAISGVSIIQIE